MVFDRSYILGSAHRALLGAISKPMVGVNVGVLDQWLTITYFHEGALDEDEREALEVAATEMISDYTFGVLLDVRYIAVSEGGERLSAPGHWAFLAYGFEVER